MVKNRNWQWRETLVGLAIFNLIFIPALFFFELLELTHWLSGATILLFLDETIGSFFVNLWTILFYNLFIFCMANRNIKIMKKIIVFLVFFMVFSVVISLIWIGANIRLN